MVSRTLNQFHSDELIIIMIIQFTRRETSLDGPIIKQKMPSPTPHQPATSMYWRDKNKLSSQSMHSPGRSSTINQSTIQKQPLPSPNSSASSTTNLNKSLSTSATALSTTDSISDSEYYHYQQQMSPPYYHQASAHSATIGKAPAPLPQSTNSATTSNHSPLRRTVSSLSSNRSEQYPVTPTDSQPPPITPTGDIDTPHAIPSSEHIHIESPKNMTVVQQAKFQPYKEVSKPFEMSDFYKYSTKFRQKNTNATQLPTTSVTSPTIEQNSPQLPPKNINLMQHHRATANNSPAMSSPYTIRYH